MWTLPPKISNPDSICTEKYWNNGLPWQILSKYQSYKEEEPKNVTSELLKLKPYRFLKKMRSEMQSLWLDINHMDVKNNPELVIKNNRLFFVGLLLFSAGVVLYVIK